MAGSIDDTEIELECESCGVKTKKSIGWARGSKMPAAYNAKADKESWADMQQFLAEIFAK